MADAVRAGVVCTSTEVSASTTAMPATSISTARRSGRGSSGAARLRTRLRENAATPMTAANSTTLAMISCPYAVVNRALSVETSISAWTTPARKRAVTASVAQRDQTGRIAPSSRGAACRNRNAASMTSPPSQTAMPARCAMSTTTETAGTGDAAGWPDDRPGGQPDHAEDDQQDPVGDPAAAGQQRAEQEGRRREHAEPDQVRGAERAAEHVPQRRRRSK